MLSVPGTQLDAIDLRILDALQSNGRIQNNDLAKKVGLSPPPCLRRVRSLLERGFIKTIRALLDEKKLGYEVMSFVSLQLESQSDGAMKTFEKAIAASPYVQQCWLISGETDYLIKCVATNIAHIQAILAEFAAMPNVRSVKSLLALREVKDAPLRLPAAGKN